MIISFFEEYPTKENLEKIKEIKFQTKLYIAASSIDEFNKIKSQIKNKKVKEIIYWPILKIEEGYWLSPFSKRSALQRIMNETKNVSLLWDAELPRKRSLLITQLPYFFKNKRLINDFFKNYKGTIYTAEYFPEKGIFGRLLEYLGLSFSPNKYGNYQGKMVYSSVHDFNEKFIKAQMQCGVQKYDNKFIIGLGVLATGINENEPIMSKERLERDLKLAKESGLKEVIIFRLAGLNKGYLKVISKYAQK
ncbi:MAG: hypothetical protein KKA65_05275 [Nanoarchaeota archaeon]|nr:hypothetical protein [Nanoarchaeota archaeon]MBU4352530.1 hypothetical protein [Nanoarchaeota archaeon]MBU4456883.1 hypothetical protein [Nanoarchaeota archaeon]MCG2719846.1 hypothetical protein [Nanoarchaeota archaeon]